MLHRNSFIIYKDDFQFKDCYKDKDIKKIKTYILYFIKKNGE